MSLTGQIREAAAVGDLGRAARQYRDYVQNALGLIRTGAGDPALLREAHELLDLARRTRVERLGVLTAELQKLRDGAYAAEKYR